MAQYFVPQFVEQETKILGPLSLRQLVIVLVGVGINYLLYLTKNTALTIFGFLFFTLGSLAIAFLKVEGQDFITIIKSALSLAFSSKVVYWEAEHEKDGIKIVEKEPIEQVTQKINVVKRSVATEGERLSNLQRLQESFSKPSRPQEQQKEEPRENI